MKLLTFDQFEFDDPDSEERLEVAVSRRNAFPHPDAKTFVASTVSLAASEALAGEVPFSEQLGQGLVRKYLQRYADIGLPNPCVWPTYVLTESEGEFHAVLCGPELFISYYWSTSA